VSLALTACRAVLAPGPWVRNELWKRARAVPSLDLRFAHNKSLVDAVSGQNLITFTRASSATFIDSTGTLQTAATDVPRFDHNPTTGESLGLLVEEQRTNLLLNSATLATQSVTVAAVAHTLSFYGTGTVTLSGTSTAGPAVGSGAFPARTVLTFTPTAGSLTLTVSGSVTSAQLEAGSSATSYIPNTTAATTRAADVVSITGTAFSSWYRQDEGTVFAKVVPNGIASQNYLMALPSGTTFNNSHLLYAVSGALRGETFVGGAQQSSVNIGSIAVGQKQSATYGYKLNDFAAARNGVLGTPDTSGSLPSPDRLMIGCAFASGQQLSGTIERLTFWPRRLDNSILQSLTQ